MIVNAEELAWALGTHRDFAQMVLDRIRARQRREPCVPPPLSMDGLLGRINRHRVCARCGKPQGEAECLCPEPVR